MTVERSYEEKYSIYIHERVADALLPLFGHIQRLTFFLYSK